MMTAHSYRCPLDLVGGPCPNAVACECVGPFSNDGGVFSCAGDAPCEDCRLAVDRGFRCDNCGLVDPSVVTIWRDHYCPACWKLVGFAVWGGEEAAR